MVTVRVGNQQNQHQKTRLRRISQQQIQPPTRLHPQRRWRRRQKLVEKVRMRAARQTQMLSLMMGVPTRDVHRWKLL